jgi:hypothetical protein
VIQMKNGTRFSPVPDNDADAAADRTGMVEPSGVLQGDDKPMEDCGTGTGCTDTYGADLGQDSINRLGSIRGATKSDSGDLHVGSAEKL